MSRIHRRTIKKKKKKKYPNDWDKHNSVVTHLEPDILECEVKWVLGSISMKKLVEMMEFHLSYSKS